MQACLSGLQRPNSGFFITVLCSLSTITREWTALHNVASVKFKDLLLDPIKTPSCNNLQPLKAPVVSSHPGSLSQFLLYWGNSLSGSNFIYLFSCKKKISDIRMVKALSLVVQVSKFVPKLYLQPWILILIIFDKLFWCMWSQSKTSSCVTVGGGKSCNWCTQRFLKCDTAKPALWFTGHVSIFLVIKLSFEIFL